jgi:glutamine amidotransferase
LKVAVIKYNAGNVHSVRLAMQRIGVEPVITDDPDFITNADRVIFPGVGEASTAMQFLNQKGLSSIIVNLKQPVLGICLGLQLMCEYSEENDTKCLGIFNSVVKKFPPGNKVPHMGWNSIEELKGELFKKVSENSYVYFVHSYYAERNKYSASETEYILPFASSLKKDNFYAVQFHPEKSGDIGSQILRNFLEI